MYPFIPDFITAGLIGKFYPGSCIMVSVSDEDGNAYGGKGARVTLPLQNSGLLIKVRKACYGKKKWTKHG